MYDGTIIPAPGGSPGPADTVTASGTPSAVAFIPARHGSKRVPGKNIRLLAGHPLLAYTDRARGRERRVLGGDRLHRLRRDGRDRPALRRRGAVPAARGIRRRHLARHRVAGACADELRAAGAHVGRLQPAAAHQPVSHRRDDPPCLGQFLAAGGRGLAARGGEMRAASRQDVGGPGRPDGAAAAACCQGHRGVAPTQPWHSTPYQALPPVYVQNASLEIAWTRVVLERRTIAGDVLCRS